MTLQPRRRPGRAERHAQRDADAGRAALHEALAAMKLGRFSEATAVLTRLLEPKPTSGSPR